MVTHRYCDWRKESTMDHIAYRYLASFNRSVGAALNVLQKLSEYPELQTDSFLVYQAYFREHRSNANLSILEALHDTEERIGGASCRERLAYERKVRDPDDCYFDVMKREKERQELGLPSLIGIRLDLRQATVEDSSEEIDSEVNVQGGTDGTRNIVETETLEQDQD
jgi:hypothetical protein